MILAIAITDRVERTYNLTVAGPHTFLVGEDGAVVHNNLCNKLAHIFGQSTGRHNLGPLLDTVGGSESAAFAAVQRAADQALAAGRLQPGPNGILPQAGAVLNVNGVLIQLSGGRIVNGSVAIGSFSGVIRVGP